MRIAYFGFRISTFKTSRRIRQRIPIGSPSERPSKSAIRICRSAILVTALLVALCCPAAAQQAASVPRVGFLSQGPVAGPNLDAFREGLREHGYIEGKNIVTDHRDSDGKPDSLPDLASDLLTRKVDAIVAVGSEASLAAKNATTATPIIMAGASDPVGTGLVASLTRPGGNVTGLGAFGPEASGKRLELLKEVFPRLSRVAAIAYNGNPAYKLQLKEVKAAAQALKLQLQIIEVQRPSDFDAAFETARNGRVEAVNTLTSAFLAANRKKLVESAAKSRLPTIYSNASFVEAGGLMFYGPSVSDNYRRAAGCVDKILRGAKPTDLPVEQPKKFEFVINLDSARQLGLTFAPNVLARADRVIR